MFLISICWLGNPNYWHGAHTVFPIGTIIDTQSSLWHTRLPVTFAIHLIAIFKVMESLRIVNNRIMYDQEK